MEPEFVPTQGHGKTSKANQTHCRNGHPFDSVNTYINPKSKKRCCRICQSDRNRRVFEQDIEGNRLKNTLHMQEWRSQNRERDRKNWTELRRKKKEWLDTQKTACTVCGEADIRCIDFHHNDPAKKSANLSVAVAHWSIKRLQAEMEKCTMVCANCHRKIESDKRQQNLTNTLTKYVGL